MNSPVVNSPSPASDPAPEPALVEQLRQSLGMLQVAFDASVESMLIIDGDRRVHWANQSSATLLVDGVPIQVMNRCLDALMTLHLPGGGVMQQDHPLHPSQPLPLKEGEECLELTLISGVRTTARQVRWQPVAILQAKDHLLITIRDLSPEQKALLQQQRFMTDLTHELRTPLTIISEVSSASGVTAIRTSSAQTSDSRRGRNPADSPSARAPVTDDPAGG